MMEEQLKKAGKTIEPVDEYEKMERSFGRFDPDLFLAELGLNLDVGKMSDLGVQEQAAPGIQLGHQAAQENQPLFHQKES